VTLSKRLEDARQAFEQRNATASQRAHDPRKILQAVEEHGSATSQFIGNMVYGGLDGIISVFAIVSGVAGAQLDSRILLILGAATLLGDGFSMGVGAYLSQKSEREYYEKERQRESWEVENYPQGEKEELTAIYRKRGYPIKDARKLVEIKARDKARWVEAMMIEELGLIKDERTPLGAAMATFLAFVVFGLLPLIIFLIDLIFKLHMDSLILFGTSIGLSAASLFGLGAAKVFVTRRSAWKSGLEMLVVGGLAATVAYFIGVLLKPLGG
jgi:VIT1/CCC1 family predicted Fe2+/Mn2+ transporter